MAAVPVGRGRVQERRSVKAWRDLASAGPGALRSDFSSAANAPRGRASARPSFWPTARQRVIKQKSREERKL